MIVLGLLAIALAPVALHLIFREIEREPLYPEVFDWGRES